MTDDKGTESPSDLDAAPTRRDLGALKARLEAALAACDPSVAAPEGTPSEISAISSADPRRMVFAELRTALGDYLAEIEPRAALLDHLQDGVVLCTPGAVLHVNPALLAACGYQLADLVGRPPCDFVIESERHALSERIERLFAGADEPPVVYHLLAAAGEPLPFEVRSRKILHRGADALMCVLRDQRERRQNQAELRGARDLWRALAENAPDFIIHATPDGEILYINRTRPGATPADVVGTRVADYLGSDSEGAAAVAAALAKVRRNRCSASVEVRAGRPGQEPRWYEARLAPIIEDGQVTSVVVVARDVRDRKQLEQNLRAAYDAFYDLFTEHAELFQSLARNVDEQLIGPLTVTQWEIEAALENLPAGGPATTSAPEPTAALARMLEDLRAFINTADHPLLEQGLPHVVADDLQRLGDQAESGNAALVIQYTPPGGWPTIDKRLTRFLYFVWRELLNNARKHARSEKLEVRLSHDDSGVELLVRDNGVGFDLIQAHAPKRGLRRVQSRARMFGGFAEVRSRPGEGAEIRVRLPLTA